MRANFNKKAACGGESVLTRPIYTFLNKKRRTSQINTKIWGCKNGTIYQN